MALQKKNGLTCEEIFELLSQSDDDSDCADDLESVSDQRSSSDESDSEDSSDCESIVCIYQACRLQDLPHLLDTLSGVCTRDILEQNKTKSVKIGM